MENKRIKTSSIVILVLILVTIAFIWGNSIKSIPDSKSESEYVKEIVEPVLEPVVGKGNVTDHLVRKLAHFTEFFLLGCCLIGLALVNGRHGFKPTILSMLTGLVVAGIDETIQIFAERGSQVTDVLLDFFGVICGVLFVLLVRCIIMAILKRRASVKA